MRDDSQMSPWAIGLVTFAAVMMIVTGMFQAFSGLVAIFEDSFFVVVDNYLIEVDVTVWGWVRLLIGLVALVAGYMILAQQRWAVLIGMVIAGVSAFENFFFIPYYPIWSILILALDVLILWALSVYLRALSSY